MKNMNYNSKVILVKKEDEIIGFALLLISKEICINLRIGLDYRYAHDYFTYFILHYYNIDFAIRNNLEKISFGQTSYLAKLELGAYLVPLEVYATHKKYFINLLLKFLLNLLFKKYEYLTTTFDPYAYLLQKQL